MNTHRNRLDERYLASGLDARLAPLTTVEAARAVLEEGVRRYQLFTRPSFWAVNNLLRRMGQAPIVAPPRR